jgi:hypothetical protein
MGSFKKFIDHLNDYVPEKSRGPFDNSQPIKYIHMYGAYLVIGIIALVLFFIFSKQYFGLKHPGSFYERTEYSAKVFVLVFPSDGTKNYYIPADIDRTEGAYDLTAIYWPNGGTTTFDNCQDLKLNTKVLCSTTDNSGNDIDYHIQLTGNVVKD